MKIFFVGIKVHIKLYAGYFLSLSLFLFLIVLLVMGS